MHITPELSRLIEMHTYGRPAGGVMERAFIARYLVPLGCTPDEHGNYMLVLGDSPRHVFSSHTDTVHKEDQRISVRLKRGTLRARGNASCLGADDTVGVWLMCELIRRRVPGRYVFHYGEECGCIGSRALVAARPTWLDETDMVIAFDRRGTSDVITHQCGNLTASDTFAFALAASLNADGLTYAPSDRGAFTDSNEYADVVAECTNLSVGYAGAHSDGETVDVGHALRLLERVAVLDVAALPIVRTPGDDGWTTLPYRGGDSDTFWRTYHETSYTSSSSARPCMPTYLSCYECGEECEPDDVTCASCGCDYPACLDEAEADMLVLHFERETPAERSIYLDDAMADVQAELQDQLRRRRLTDS